MVYLFGKLLNNKSLALYSVIKLYGLGFYLVKIMFNDLCIGTNYRVKNLSQNLLIKLLKWVEKNKIFVETLLTNKIKNNINRLKGLKNYRGLQHSYDLFFKKVHASKKI